MEVFQNFTYINFGPESELSAAESMVGSLNRESGLVLSRIALYTDTGTFHLSMTLSPAQTFQLPIKLRKKCRLPGMHYRVLGHLTLTSFLNLKLGYDLCFTAVF